MFYCASIFLHFIVLLLSQPTSTVKIQLITNIFNYRFYILKNG